MRRLLPEETLRALMGHHSAKMSNLYDHPAREAQIKALESARAPLEAVFGEK